jgi:hypothetical protein
VIGRLCGRGPDNEPLITDCEVIAEVDPSVADRATELVEGFGQDSWGPLDRTG